MDGSSANEQLCSRTDVGLTHGNFGVICCTNMKTILLARIAKIAEEIAGSLFLESLGTCIRLEESSVHN